MKPTAAPPSPADTGQTLLQAARDLPQPEPGPALDAFILDAAARRAAEIREARAKAAAVLETPPRIRETAPSALERFARWLLGTGEMRGHLGQVLAASLVMGLALGIVMQIEQATPPETVPATAQESAKVATAPAGQNFTEMAADKAAPMPDQAPAVAALAAEAPKRAARAAANAFDAATPASAPPPPPKARALLREKNAAPAAPEPAAEMPQALAEPALRHNEVGVHGVAEARQSLAKPSSHAAPPMSSAPAPAKADALPAAPSAAGALTADSDIDAQLKRILDLRRAGKEEEAALLLRELRARHRDANIDERLRRLEDEKNK
ncbi:MAG: hypothetical protein FWF20_04590 [Betaproteobacteria bacterium]|nr:hypothetical protein [Betaproteobacteria bacterium]MCL2886056.1 hypothetical protein [Betaproteobacteria bacterium]